MGRYVSLSADGLNDVACDLDEYMRYRVAQILVERGIARGYDDCRVKVTLSRWAGETIFVDLIGANTTYRGVLVRLCGVDVRGMAVAYWREGRGGCSVVEGLYITLDAEELERAARSCGGSASP